ncbi:MAG: nucleotide exchange factor GrpE [bacterium]
MKIEYSPINTDHGRDLYSGRIDFISDDEKKVRIFICVSYEYLSQKLSLGDISEDNISKWMKDEPTKKWEKMGTALFGQDLYYDIYAISEKGKENGLEYLINKTMSYLDGWKRAKADYINREKSIAQEKSALREIMEEMMILEFLPVLDNLKVALATGGNQVPDSNWVKGIEHVVKQFENTLNNFGVQAMDLIGKEYDAAYAEAVDRSFAPSFAEASDDKEATDGMESKGGDKVIKIVLDGYKKGERVIRPARVIIG